jgi:hypothetical protein
MALENILRLLFLVENPDDQNPGFDLFEIHGVACVVEPEIPVAQTPHIDA